MQRHQIGYAQAMDRPLDDDELSGFAAEFDRAIREDDDSAAREILAAGFSIHIMRDDTPEGYVVRVHPDGREELIAVDFEEAAKILGR